MSFTQTTTKTRLIPYEGLQHLIYIQYQFNYFSDSPNDRQNIKHVIRLSFKQGCKTHGFVGFVSKLQCLVWLELCTWGSETEVVWSSRAAHLHRWCCLCCESVWIGSAAHLVLAGMEAGEDAPGRMRRTADTSMLRKCICFNINQIQIFIFTTSDANLPKTQLIITQSK